MFNPVVVSKLRGCDRISLKLDDVCAEARVPDRATVIQKQTSRRVQFRGYRAVSNRG